MTNREMGLVAIFVRLLKIVPLQEHEICLLSIYFALFVANNIKHFVQQK